MVSKDVITEKTKVPLSVVGSTIVLTVYGTILFMKLDHKLDHAVTVQQVQEWIDNAREKNPGVTWPRLPPRQSESGDTVLLERIAVNTKRNEP